MRTLIFGFLFILLCIGINNTSDNAWTEKRPVNALITEKWEDWSGEATKPYKVMFAVEVSDPSGKNGLLPTVYYEKGFLDAREWKSVVPMSTVRAYTTSYKDLGVPPTEAQKKKDWWNSFFLGVIFLFMPIFGVILAFHYQESRW